MHADSRASGKDDWDLGATINATGGGTMSFGFNPLAGTTGSSDGGDSA